MKTFMIAKYQGGLNMQIHVIRPGDTLWAISQAYNFPISELIAANEIPNPDRTRRRSKHIDHDLGKLPLGGTWRNVICD